MKNCVPAFVCTALLFVCAGRSGVAQERVTAAAPDTAYSGDLKGRVVTLAGVEAAYAEVKIYRENVPVSHTVADANGRYFVRVPAGNCRAVFFFPGYEPASSGTILVQDSKTTVHNAVLKRTPIQPASAERNKEDRR